MTTTTQTQEQPATTTCTPPSTQPRPRSPSLSCALHAGYDHVVGHHHRIYLPLLLLCFLSRTALLADTCCSCSDPLLHLVTSSFFAARFRPSPSSPLSPHHLCLAVSSVSQGHHEHLQLQGLPRTCSDPPTPVF